MCRGKVKGRVWLQGKHCALGGTGFSRTDGRCAFWAGGIFFVREYYLDEKEWVALYRYCLKNDVYNQHVPIGVNGGREGKAATSLCMSLECVSTTQLPSPHASSCRQPMAFP